MHATLAQLEQLTSCRRYVPAAIWGDNLKLERFENYDWDRRLVISPSEECGPCITCQLHTFYTGAGIIAIDGACRGNGGANARAACGVFGNIGSELNNAFVLSESQPTSQRAELHAAISALRSVRNLYKNYDPAGLYEEIIIKTDSAHLVNSMTSHINAWRSNGYMTAQNTPVVNRALFRTLDNLVFTLRDEAGVQIRFWHVRRERNRPADNLANAALDGIDWTRFGANDLFAGGPRPYAHSCPVYDGGRGY